jgi:hypothetical protein
MTLVIGEREDALQLAGEDGSRELVSGVHEGAPLFDRREHKDLSAISAWYQLLMMKYF